MKRLIKADLAAILRLVPVYRAVTPESVDLDVAKLGRFEHTDYLFLARQAKSGLYDLPAVYTQDSYENLAWTYGLATPCVPVVALFLHVDKAVEDAPWGSVTLLDYQTAARDVETFSKLPQAERDRHIQLMCKRWTRNARYCTILDVIQYLRTGEVK